MESSGRSSVSKNSLSDEGLDLTRADPPAESKAVWSFVYIQDLTLTKTDTSSGELPPPGCESAAYFYVCVICGGMPSRRDSHWLLWSSSPSRLSALGSHVRWDSPVQVGQIKQRKKSDGLNIGEGTNNDPIIYLLLKVALQERLERSFKIWLFFPFWEKTFKFSLKHPVKILTFTAHFFVCCSCSSLHISDFVNNDKLKNL